MIALKIVYWMGILVESAIRIPLRKKWKKSPKSEQRISMSEKVLLGLLAVVMFLLPLVYTFSKWLDFADYTLPPWMGWLGVFLMGCALLVFIRAHIYLKSNWSPSLEIFEKHSLVTSGIYKYIRHPMYASQWIWVVAQLMLLQNWLAGPVDLAFFIFFYIFRVKGEEKMMLDTFGEEYRLYMKHTGAVIPKIQ